MARSKSKHLSADTAIRWARGVRSLWEDDGSELPSDITHEYFRVPGLQPDDLLFEKLGSLAQVSAEGIEGLRRGVLYELGHQQPRPHKPPPPPAGSKKRALAQLRQSTKLSRDLSAIVSNLDQQALEALIYVDCSRHNFGRPPGVDDEPPAPLPDFSDWSKSQWFKIIAEFAELSSEALTFVRTSRRPNPRGRPRRGAFSQWRSGSLTEFTLRLLLEVRAAGGRLTLDKNGRTGTLIDALELLRPHVRPGLIPNELPMSTLARVKALDQKIATALRST